MSRDNSLNEATVHTHATELSSFLLTTMQILNFTFVDFHLKFCGADLTQAVY